MKLDRQRLCRRRARHDFWGYSQFEACPWSQQIGGINTEECRSFRVLNEELETRLYELDLQTGARRHLVTAPRGVSASGVSETGGEMVLVEYGRSNGYDLVPRTNGTPGYEFVNTHSTMDECQASWWSVPATPSQQAEERFRVQTPDMCFSAYGGATIAPLRAALIGPLRR